MRRFFIGLISGGFVATLGLVIVSQIAAPPLAQQADAGVQPRTTGGVANESVLPTDDAPVVPAQTVVAQADVTETPEDPPAEPAALTAVSGAASDAQTPAVVPDAAPAETVASAVPEVAEEAPSEETSAPAIDLPVVAETAPDPIAAPVPDESVAVVPDPVAAPVLAQPAEPLTDVPQPRPSADATDGAATPAADSTANLGQTGPDAPAAPGADAPPSLADLPPPPPLTPEEQVVLAPVPPPTPERVVVAENPVQPAPAPEAVVVPENPILPAPEVAVLPDTTIEAVPVPDVIALAPVPDVPSVINVDSAPSVLQTDTPLIEPTSELPVTPSLGSAGEGVIVNRAAQPDPVSESPVLPAAAQDGQPPLVRFAAPFENTEAKPLFSIVLIDTGEATLDRMAIASLPFAVSVAIDPLAPDAATHAALYLAGGKEVLMLASGIPDGANPADLEQTFQALDVALPEAVAVVDTEAAQFQDDRPLATQIVPILAAQGRGLVTWDRGLNAADQVARREGLASAVIFRRIDGEGEAAPAIRRYLDRAAFKAAQEGQVTVIGEVRAETVAALLEWTIEGRASSVAIAPVSAQLTLR